MVPDFWRCQRTRKQTSGGRLPGPIARRRKPKGKGPSACADACKSGRACLGGRGNAPARGRQARVDLTRVKSTKKTEATGCLHSSLLNSGALKFIPDTRDQTGPAPTPARRCTGRRCGGACGCRHRAGSSSSAGISRLRPKQIQRIWPSDPECLVPQEPLP